jgi:hypothetical protein
MREVAGLFEQPLRPLLLHSDMLEGQYFSHRHPRPRPRLAACVVLTQRAKMTCRSNRGQPDLWSSMESADTSGERKPSSAPRGRRLTLRTCQYLEGHGLYQYSIRHDVAVQARQLVTLPLSTSMAGDCFTTIGRMAVQIACRVFSIG